MMKRILLTSIIMLLIGLQAILQADDTDIFGGGVINIPPNVLIMFDNSGSMEEWVPAQDVSGYNSSTVYAGSRYSNYVYYQNRSTGVWYGFTWLSNISCTSARSALEDYGFWRGMITGSPYNCGGTTWRTLATGNYLNFLADQGIGLVQKIYLAKNTVKDLIQTTDGVRFGLFIFNYSEGGRLISPLQTRTTQAEKDALKTQIDGISASTWTPLAETLAEIGLYYARQPSWFNSGVNYLTDYDPAIQWRCQKNYIIVMTDGESTYDSNSKLWDTLYINDKVIGDYDEDVALYPCKPDEFHFIEFDEDGNCTAYPYVSNGSDFLDDVAKFLHDEDLLDSSFSDLGGKSFDSDDFPHQNILTYTIGFDIDNNLLLETADENHGNGAYFTTNDDIPLSEIFEKILGGIMETNMIFVSPVVPVSRMNRTYADNGLYLGIFSPDSSNPGLWKGNLKKFGLSKDGEILDRDGNSATDSSGTIKESAKTAWYDVSGNEGLTVDRGGAGAVLKNQSSRVLRTFKDGTGFISFDKSNSYISPADLGLSTADEKDDLMDFVTASGIYAPDYNGTDARPREWVMGDILHSRPAILYDFTNNRNVIFVGANDGFLHCFVDNDQGSSEDISDDTVSEVWAFIPWDLLPNLKHLPPEGSTVHVTGDSVHDIYVDGSPVVYRSGGNTYVVFGLRRGGADIATGAELDNQYFILNVTNYASPTFVKSISKNILGSELLGQSWSTPLFSRIKLSGGASEQDVLLIAGGYDTNQDNADPGASDTKGRAIFAVEAATGNLASTNINDFNFTSYDKMKYSMVDLRTYDDDDDGCDDVIYAPSLGGDLFVFESKKKSDGTYDGIWSKRLLFQADDDGGTDKLRKFHSAPGIAQELWGDYVYIGSGDREKPNDTTVTNRFYAIRNTWPETWDDNNPITDSDLSDETADVLQGTTSSPSSMTEQEKADYRLALGSMQGWFIELENEGEKVVSTPLVYNKVVYFTTFSPSVEGYSADDLCSVGAGSGFARLYAVDYKTGEAVFPWFDGDATTLTKEDRYLSIGTGIPSDPVLVVTERGAFVAVGTEGGAVILDTGDVDHIHRYYWLQQ